MAGKNTAVFGIYTDRSSVDRAVEALKAAGFSNNDVSALFPENKGTKDFAHEKEHEGTRRCYDRRRNWSIAGWRVGLAGRNWRVGNSWPRTLHRSWSDHGSTGWSRSWRRGRRSYRCLDRNGHTGIRGQALRRPRERRWDSALRSLG